MRCRLSALIATALALVPAGAAANEADAYGLGSRSTALGSAVVADATDFSANYYNPAGLVGARGPSLSIGYVYVVNQLSIDGKDNGVSNVHGLVGGLVAPGTFAKIPFAFGVGTYLPDVGLSRVKALRQETPRWALYDERASILFLAANLAVRPISWLELGGGIAFLAATRGAFEITGQAVVASPYDSQLRHKVDADLTSIRYPQLGARIKVTDLGYVGFAYRGETKLKLAIDAHLEGTVSVAGLDVPLIYDLASRTIDAFLPQQFVFGVSFQKIDRLRVNVDVTFVDWSAYESPTANTKAHLDVTLPPGAPITLPADPKPTRVIDPKFENRLVPRIGVEYLVPIAGEPKRLEGEKGERRTLEIPVRAGYVYENSPVPPQTGTTNFVDADRHTFSFGTGIVLTKTAEWLPATLALDVHGQLSILPERATRKDNAADFVGDYRAKGTMLGAGTTLTMGF